MNESGQVLIPIVVFAFHLSWTDDIVKLFVCWISPLSLYAP